MNIAKPRFTKRGKTPTEHNKPLVSCYKELYGRKYVADGVDEQDACFSCNLLITNTFSPEYNRGKGEFYEEKIKQPH